MDTATDLAGEVINRARGRKDSTGQEGVIKEKPMKDSLSELMTLKGKLDSAKDKLNDAIKAVAEKCNMQAKVIRKAVNAKSADKIEEVQREVDQLAIALEVAKKG